ncbi:MAG: hypothetical protein ACREU1_12595 [Burkholderiales bacterium]
MNLPPEQLKLRLDAAMATLKRLTDDIYLTEDTHLALCRAQWHIYYQLERLADQQRAR